MYKITAGQIVEISYQKGKKKRKERKKETLALRTSYLTKERKSVKKKTHQRKELDEECT